MKEGIKLGISQWMSVDVKEHRKSNKALQIIDVRQPSEYDGGHIPGAKLIPLGELASRFEEISKDGETVVVCHSGGRSMNACGFLDKMGYGNIHNLMGGMQAWDGDIE